MTKVKAELIQQFQGNVNHYISELLKKEVNFPSQSLQIQAENDSKFKEMFIKWLLVASEKQRERYMQEFVLKYAAPDNRQFIEDLEKKFNVKFHRSQ